MFETSGNIGFFIVGSDIGLDIIKHPPNECFGCSACCQFCGEPPFETMEAVQKLPKILKDELLQYIHKLEHYHIPSRGSQNMPCLWLNIESGICLNYEYRPKICRDFVVSGSECLSFRDRIRKDQ